MKQHTTNYIDTFIIVSEDTKAATGTKPESKTDKMTVAAIEYDLIAKNPYKYTSDDVLFQVFAVRNYLTKAELKEARAAFFSKGQACFRASPLTKTYGFGVHSNNQGKIAIYGMETSAYAKFVEDKEIKKVKAMRTKRQ